ncbi:hypothetical protein C8Q80DRAFT_1192025 [Daedaleopsis nitida]|nr:hypothetical protein C8Q80DRAFT_1192025 [Daedaleopsis nitida]
MRMIVSTPCTSYVVSDRIHAPAQASNLPHNSAFNPDPRLWCRTPHRGLRSRTYQYIARNFSTPSCVWMLRLLPQHVLPSIPGRGVDLAPAPERVSDEVDTRSRSGIEKHLVLRCDTCRSNPQTAKDFTFTTITGLPSGLSAAMRTSEAKWKGHKPSEDGIFTLWTARKLTAALSGGPLRGVQSIPASVTDAQRTSVCPECFLLLKKREEVCGMFWLTQIACANVQVHNT